MKYVDLVNVKQGTNSVPAFSAGKHPAGHGRSVSASISFALETRPEASLFYNPNDMVTTGIRLTHAPSPWINDYGNFVLMAQSGARVYFDTARRSGFRPNETVMTPYELSVRFLAASRRFDVGSRPRAAPRVPLPLTRRIPIACRWVNTEKEVMLHVDAKARRVTGYTRANTGAAPENFAEYFVMQFDCDFDMDKTVVGDLSGKRYDATQSDTAPGLCLSLAFAGTQFPRRSPFPWPSLNQRRAGAA